MKTDSDLQEIVAQALAAMEAEEGPEFDIEHINLAELGRRTNIPRHKLHRIQKNGFKVLPNGNKGRKASDTVINGYTGIVDNLLNSNATNSEVIFDRIHNTDIPEFIANAICDNLIRFFRSFI